MHWPYLLNVYTEGKKGTDRPLISGHFLLRTMALLTKSLSATISSATYALCSRYVSLSIMFFYVFLKSKVQLAARFCTLLVFFVEKTFVNL